MGKTSVTLAAIKVLRAQKMLSKVLVIAPLRPCYLVWPKELQKWTDFYGLKMIVLHGPKKDRLLKEKADIYVINPEGLEWLTQAVKTKLPNSKKVRVDINLERWKSLGFDLLVVDELSKFKHTNTTRFKMTKLIIGFFRRRWGLTGSPAANGLMGLFGQMYVLDEGRSLGRFITHYRMKYFTPIDAMGYTWKLQPGADQLIYKRIAPMVLRLNADDYLEMPQLIENVIRVDLPDKIQKMYDMMENDLLAKINKHVVVASNAAASSTKCLAEGTEVLTMSGWKQIERCTSFDQVWDGLEWVPIDGSVCNGDQPVVECHGVRMTQNHRVLTLSGWKTAQEILNGQSSNQYDREEVRTPHCDIKSWEQKNFWFIGARDLARCMRLWKYASRQWNQFAFNAAPLIEIMRMPSWRTAHCSARYTWDVTHDHVHQMVWDGSTMRQPKNQRMGILRRTWYSCMQQVADVQRILERYGARVFAGANVGTKERQWPLQQEELLLGDNQRTEQQYAEDYSSHHASWEDDISASRRVLRSEISHTLCEDFSLAMGNPQSVPATHTTKVYDLINAGPRHRFVVRGRDGRLLIVHNCRQIANGGIYLEPGLLEGFKLPPSEREWVNLHTEKVDALEDLIDELQGQPLLVAYDFQHDFDRLKKKFGDDIPYIGSGVTPKRAQELEALWNAGKLPLLFGHPMSIAHGLNLQEQAEHVCWHSLTWDYELYDQFVRRVRRQGNKAKRVFSHMIVARKTIDEVMLASLRAKEKGQNTFFDGLKKLANTRGKKS